MKDELIMLPDADPVEAAKLLVSLPEDAQVRSIMNRLSPGDAARIVACAPNAQAQTRLIWSLEKTQRAAVVDELTPVTVAALIQNQERRNRRLLGDVSVEGFAQILEFCSPKQRYYWMSLANSFADVGANLLVLLLPPKDVAEALLTAPEFRKKLYRLKAYMAGGMDETPPVDDARLKAVLMRLSEYDADRYYEVMDAAIALVDAAREGAETAEAMEQEPVVLPRIPEVPPLVPESPDAEAGPDAEAEIRPEETPFLPMPVPIESDSMMRASANLLTPARRQALDHEMENAFRNEVIGDGGSVAMADLERAAARLQAYLRLGLQGVPEQPERVAEILETVPLRDIVHRGTVVLEQMRQIALRLRPFTTVMDARQRDLLGALVRPQSTVDAASGSPALLVPAADRRRRPQPIPVTDVQERLADLSVWVATARALGLRALTEKLAAAPNGSLAVSAALAVSLLSYGQWDPGALDSRVLRAFRDAHFDRSRGEWLPGTLEQIRAAADAWAAGARIEAAMRPRVTNRVMEAASRLGEFLATARSVSWDHFAPGRLPRRRRMMLSLDEEDEEAEEEGA